MNVVLTAASGHALYPALWHSQPRCLPVTHLKAQATVLTAGLVCDPTDGPPSPPHGNKQLSHVALHSTSLATSYISLFIADIICTLPVYSQAVLFSTNPRC